MGLIVLLVIAAYNANIPPATQPQIQQWPVQDPSSVPAVAAPRTVAPATPRRQTATDSVGPDWEEFGKEIVAVLDQAAASRVAAFQYLDGSQLNATRIDPILENQKRQLCWLIDQGYHLEYTNRKFVVTDITFQGDTQATVLARVTESRRLVRNSGNLVTDYGREDYPAVYQLRRIGEHWYIYCLQGLSDGGPVQCSVQFDPPYPCN